MIVSPFVPQLTHGALSAPAWFSPRGIRVAADLAVLAARRVGEHRPVLVRGHDPGTEPDMPGDGQLVRAAKVRVGAGPLPRCRGVKSLQQQPERQWLAGRPG